MKFHIMIQYTVFAYFCNGLPTNDGPEIVEIEIPSNPSLNNIPCCIPEKCLTNNDMTKPKKRGFWSRLKKGCRAGFLEGAICGCVGGSLGVGIPLSCVVCPLHLAVDCIACPINCATCGTCASCLNSKCILCPVDTAIGLTSDIAGIAGACACAPVGAACGGCANGLGIASLENDGNGREFLNEILARRREQALNRKFGVLD